MPWNVTYGAGKHTDREILKGATGLDNVRSVVIKAASVAERATDDPEGYGSSVLPYEHRALLRGQILCKDSVDTTKYVPYTGAAGQVPAGVLDNDVTFFDATSASDEAANMIWFGAVFDASALIGYTGNEAAVAAALDTCKFE